MNNKIFFDNAVAIIAEFNPLHNGHKRIIDKALEISKKVIIIQSGNICQRGEIATLSKNIRAQVAIKLGCSMVIEIPPIFCLSSAKYYAIGACEIIKQLGIKNIIFGSESGNMQTLIKCAECIKNAEENNEIYTYLKKREGYSKAIANLLYDKLNLSLSSNDRLAIEYILALDKYKINLHTIVREDNYLSESIGYTFPSASAIRSKIKESKFDDISAFLPSQSFDIAQHIKPDILSNADENLFLLSRATALISGENEFINIYDTEHGQAQLCYKALKESTNLLDYSKKVVSSSMTFSKAKRILLRSILKLDSKTAKKLLKQKYCYKVLAVKKEIVSNVQSRKLYFKYGDLLNRHIENSYYIKFQNSCDSLFNVINKTEDNNINCLYL